MIEYSNGNIHDIDHFIKVWAYAKNIAELENIDSEIQYVLEIAAITHDIACSLCREKYVNTNGKYQEIEEEYLVREFLTEFNLSSKQIEKVAFLVAHHHSFNNIQGIDYQILIEADYIVNAEESNYSRENIKNFSKKFFKTNTGIMLLKSIYNI